MESESNGLPFQATHQKAEHIADRVDCERTENETHPKQAPQIRFPACARPDFLNSPFPVRSFDPFDFS